jgi:hypothetical protein
MSVTTEIPISDLAALADRLPPPGTVDVTIEVIGEDVGDQVEVQKLPWHRLVYDSAGDILELSVGGRGHGVPVVLRHEIQHPSRVWVEEDGPSVESISIDREGGPKTLVRFFERKALDPGR